MSTNSLLGYPADARLLIINADDFGPGVVEHLAALAESRGMPVPGAISAMTDEDVLRILVQPGFSTAAAVTELSGRGVGMDVVANRMRALGGALTLLTREGGGSTFTLRLPLSKDRPAHDLPLPAAGITAAMHAPQVTG